MTSDLPTATIAPARTWSAVLFDLDGTIVDSASEIMDSLAHMFTEMGVPVPDQEILRSYVGPPLLDSLRMTAGFTDVDAWEALNVYRDHYDEHLLRAAQQVGRSICDVQGTARHLGARQVQLDLRA